MTTTHLDNIAIGELRTNAKGGKCANVGHKSGKPILIVAPVPLTCPFVASVHQGDGTETGLNINYSALEGIESMFRNIDGQLIQATTAAKDSLWLGTGLTDAQVRENYASPLKTRKDYPTTLCCKIDSEKCRCWSWEGAKIHFLSNRGKGCQAYPRIQLQGLWFMAPPKWGATFQTTDLRVQKPCMECPW